MYYKLAENNEVFPLKIHVGERKGKTTEKKIKEERNRLDHKRKTNT